MNPICLSIKQEETGKRIKQLLQDHGYKVKDIQGAMGFETPQVVYKWLSGKSAFLLRFGEKNGFFALKGV